MHYVSYLAVEAEHQQAALEAASAFLSDHEGHAYDWYVVGGRWSGACNGDDLICAGAGRSAFDEVVGRACAARDQHFNEARQHIFGPDARVGSDQTDGSEDGPEREAYLERRWASFKETSAELCKVANSTSVPVVHGYSMVGYYLRQFSDMLGGMYSSNSYFYDTVAITNTTDSLYERVSVNPDNQWIVVVDLHN